MTVDRIVGVLALCLVAVWLVWLGVYVFDMDWWAAAIVAAVADVVIVAVVRASR